MAKEYQLRVSSWIEGILKKADYFFDTLDAARDEIKKHHGHMKIYNRSGEIIHSEERTLKIIIEEKTITEEIYA